MRFGWWVAVGLVGCGAASTVHGDSLRVLARTGTQAPGFPTGTTITSLGRPDWDSPMVGSGQFVFTATINGGRTVFASNAAGDAAPLAVEGTQAPGMPDGELFTDFFGYPLMGSDGHAVIVASTTTSYGVFREDDAGGLQLWARKGDPAPGLSAGTLNLGGNPQNLSVSSGRVGIYSSIQGGNSTSAGIWTAAAPGSLTSAVIAGMGAEATNTAGIPGSKITVLNTNVGRMVIMNSHGQLAYRGRASNTPNPSGLWGPASDGTMRLLAQQNAAAPGTTGVFADVGMSSTSGRHTINDQGKVLFVAPLATGTGGVASTSDSGIWLSDGNTVTKVLREGDQAAGAPAGVVYADAMSLFPMMNADGRLALMSTLMGAGVTTATNTALFGTDASGAFTMLLREGDPVPGLSGVQFGNFDTWTAINRHGTIAFTNSLLTGVGGVTTANDEAIFTRGADGSITLIAREGDSIEVSPGVFKTITRNLTPSRTFGVMGGSHQDGSSSTLDDSNNLIFLATFNDNSTAVLMATVPEPGLPAMLLAYTAVLLARRGRRSVLVQTWERSSSNA